MEIESLGRYMSKNRPTVLDWRAVCVRFSGMKRTVIDGALEAGRRLAINSVFRAPGSCWIMDKDVSYPSQRRSPASHCPQEGCLRSHCVYISSALDSC